MTRTPDETKRNIITCMELNMEHFMPGATQKALADAIDLIQQLEATVSEKEKVCEKLAWDNGTLIADNGQLTIKVMLLEAKVRWLESKNAELLKNVEQLQAERDSLVADVRMEGGLCSICMHADEMAHSESCKDCNALVETDHCNWEWRGVQKEDDDA